MYDQNQSVTQSRTITNNREPPIQNCYNCRDKYRHILNMEKKDLRAQLTELLDEAELEWLKPHIQKDVVIIVVPDLDILDVGVAISSDNTQSVQHWISEQLLVKPSSDILSRWNGNPTQKFQALIIQPYILVQELVA